MKITDKFSNTLLAARRNLNRNFLRKRVRRFLSDRYFEKGRVKLPFPPEGLQIDVTNLCNLKCVMCRQSIAGSSRQKGFMPIELFKKIIADAKDKIFLLQFVVTGEPLLHKDILEMITIARKAGLRTNMHSNAALLNEGLSRGLILSGLDEISFSFDTSDKTLYERLRPPAKFEDIYSNIRAFVMLKKGLKSATPFVMLQNLRPYKNAIPLRFEEGYKELFKDMDVNFFLKYFVNPAGKFDRRNFMFGEIEDFFVPQGNKYTACRQLWRRMSISWDGTVLGCCNDDAAEYAHGNLSRQGIMDVWNGAPIVKLRKRLLAGQYQDIALCKRCPALWKREK